MGSDKRRKLREKKKKKISHASQLYLSMPETDSPPAYVDTSNPRLSFICLLHDTHAAINILTVYKILLINIDLDIRYICRCHYSIPSGTYEEK